MNLSDNVCMYCTCRHRLDLAGLLGGRMASDESGSVPSGVGYGESCPLSGTLEGLGSVVSSSSGVRGRALAEILFRRTLKVTERAFLYLHDKIWGGKFALASPTPNSGGTCPPRPPVIYAHACRDSLTNASISKCLVHLIWSRFSSFIAHCVLF